MHAIYLSLIGYVDSNNSLVESRPFKMILEYKKSPINLNKSQMSGKDDIGKLGMDQAYGGTYHSC